MKRFILFVLIIYCVGYAVIRTSNTEVWQKNEQTYVIFPEEPIALYYAYRPLTYLDGALTGMQFHIGPHR